MSSSSSDPPTGVGETRRRRPAGIPHKKGVPKSGPSVQKKNSGGKGDGAPVSERIEAVAGDSCAGHGVLPDGGGSKGGQNCRKGVWVNPKKPKTSSATATQEGSVNPMRTQANVRIAIDACPASDDHAVPPLANGRGFGRRASWASHATRQPAPAVSQDTHGLAPNSVLSKPLGDTAEGGELGTEREKLVRLCDRDEQIWNEWEGVRLLGEGVYGRVYLVRNKETGEERAFKRMYLQSSRHATDDDSVAGGGVPAVVQREVASLKALRGAPNVIRLDRVFVGCRRVYLSFPVIHGGSLTELMRTYACWQEHLLYNHQSQQHAHPSGGDPPKLFHEREEEESLSEDREKRSSSSQKREKKDEDLAFVTEARTSGSSSVSPGSQTWGDPRSHIVFPAPFSYPDMPPCGLPLALCRTITQAILRGVAACHEHRIAHRDLKPDNILVEWIPQHPPPPPPPPPSPVSSARCYAARLACGENDEASVREEGHMTSLESGVHLASRSKAAEFAAAAAELLRTKLLKRNSELSGEREKEEEGSRSGRTTEESEDASGNASLPSRVEKGVESKGGAHCVKPSNGRGNLILPSKESSSVIVAKEDLAKPSTGQSQQEEGDSRTSSQKTVEDDGSKDTSQQEAPPPYPPLPRKVVIADFGLARTLPFYISSSIMPKHQLSATASTTPAVMMASDQKTQKGGFRQSKDMSQKRGKEPLKPGRSLAATSQPDGNRSSGAAPGALHRVKKPGKTNGREVDHGNSSEKTRRHSLEGSGTPESSLQSDSDENTAWRTSFSLSPEIITLNYRPLDVLLGSSSYSLCVDVWSAGCILMELLTGTEFIDGCSEFQCIMAIMRLFGNPWRREKQEKEERRRECVEESLTLGNSNGEDESGEKREGEKEGKGCKDPKDGPTVYQQSQEGSRRPSVPKRSRQTTLTRSSEWKFWDVHCIAKEVEIPGVHTRRLSFQGTLVARLDG
ncbi:putative CMGC kinase, CDK family [Neospora caninum Liverpool]|uniref:Cyclin-dependent kinase 2 homolog n=1 Tax=Neospora caninum (strain Liverpool) TaxID=572307 RepID=F0V9A2_NEOCL|nr:putative CMGC kinase, CDK family [Neospora caninum Liverpool]CBZ50327.1 putative CMGC kinase, CDK family [Neospora caninum Liverpool]|eukprot:XP_003880361.1 putative CMGC kinase, CDK family [Neospora caninum Liverpool]